MRLLLISVLLLAGCADKTSDKPYYDVKTLSVGHAYAFSLQTVEYEGHKFIWASGAGPTNSFIHHPDCDCFK